MMLQLDEVIDAFLLAFLVRVYRRNPAGLCSSAKELVEVYDQSSSRRSIGPVEPLPPSAIQIYV